MQQLPKQNGKLDNGHYHGYLASPPQSAPHPEDNPDIVEEDRKLVEKSKIAQGPEEYAKLDGNLDDGHYHGSGERTFALFTPPWFSIDWSCEQAVRISGKSPYWWWKFLNFSLNDAYILPW